ncbi:MAG: bis(5'-nucleosyl)-tetraphosphatase (symmetrical) YqeK [Candidatus Baltobacteraceae bacterium]
MPRTFAELCREVRRELGQGHRYAHTVRVARLADRLAQAHRADARRARTAGMLHDLARLFATDRLVAESEARGLALDAFERAHPVVLHARLGAELARERFGIDDEAVLSAIRKHTLASGEMSTLDTIVYLADGLEPGRKFDDRAALEALAFENLPAALAALLRSHLEYVMKRQLEPAPQTLAALRRYATTTKEEAVSA